jgi:replicative DNA helicase
MQTPESVTVGLAIKHPSALAEALGIGVSAAHFEHQVLRDLWATMALMEREAVPVDVVSLCQRCPGHIGTIMEITDVSGHSIEHYAREVIAAHWARQLRDTISEIGMQLFRRQHFEQTDAIRARAAAVLAQCSDGPSTKQSGPIGIDEAVISTLALIERRIAEATSGKRDCIPSGLATLDEKLNGGWQPGSLYIIAGRPGQGKTTLALQCYLAAIERGHSASYFTVEMPKEQLVQKLVANRARIHAAKFLSANFSNDDISRMHSHLEEIHKMPGDIDDYFGASFERLKASLAKRLRKGRLDLLVVDYIGQLRIDSKPRLTKREVVEEVSAWLKAFALENRCIVLVVAQINRQAEVSDDGPELHHLKDSGALEQDCDLALLIHRTEEKVVETKVRRGSRMETVTETLPAKSLVKLRKHRWGSDCDLDISAELEFSKFCDRPKT